MLKNITAERSVLAYGGFVLNGEKLPIGFGRELTELPTGLPPDYKFETGSINAATVAIEQLSTYDRFVVVGMTHDSIHNRGDITTGSLGLWQETKKGWKLISTPHKLEPALQVVIRELLVENNTRIGYGVRVSTPRNTEQRKVEKLAEICRLAEGRWEFDKEGNEVYLTYEYGERNFNPYNDDFWVWEIVKRAGLSVENHGRGAVKFNHPDSRYTFQQSNTSYRALRVELCDWLLGINNTVEKGAGRT